MEAALHDYFNAQQAKRTNLNTNVELSTGSKAYINKYGIAKEYGSEADYTLTAGLKSCGEAIPTPLDRTWATLEHPRGTVMAPGVPCGFENSYITASFPSSAEGVEVSAGITQMSKIGYIDVDNIYRPVQTNLLSSYAPVKSSYITGTNMTSCLGSTIRYGDPIYIKHSSSYAYTDSNAIKISSSATASTYYLQPVSGTSNREIKYGDLCLLSTTKETSSSTCGQWGCSVGTVSAANKLVLAASNNATPFRFIPGITDDAGKGIKVGESLNMVATLPTNNTLLNATVLRNRTTPYITSTNGAYNLKFVDGALSVYTSSNTVKSTIYAITSPSTTSYADFTSGKFSFYDVKTSTVPQEIIPSSTAGNVSPYKAILCNDGELVVIDGNNAVVWPTTKTDFDTPSPIYATVNDSSEIVFGDTPMYTFSITSPYYGDGTQCNVEALKDYCKESSKCVGFIHSGRNHNWQFINKDDSPDNYQMSTTYTDTYLRNISAAVAGPKCPSASTITSVPWEHMLLFPKGTALPTTGANCPSIPSANTPLYDTYMNSLNEVWQSMSGKHLDSTNVSKLTSTTTSLNSSNQAYNTAYTNVLDQYTTTSPTNNTIRQRIEDSSVLDEHHRGLAILWGIISISVISIILFRPNN